MNDTIKENFINIRNIRDLLLYTFCKVSSYFLIFLFFFSPTFLFIMWLNRSSLSFLFIFVVWILFCSFWTPITKTRHYTKTIHPINCPKITTTTATTTTTIKSTTTTTSTTTVTEIASASPKKRTYNDYPVECIPDKKVYKHSGHGKCKSCNNKFDKRCKKKHNEKCKVIIYCTPTITLPCQKSRKL